MKIFWFLLLLVPVRLYGAGAIMVDTDGTGQPVLWKDGVIHYNLESDGSAGLGALSNAEAVNLIRELFEDWANVTLNGVGTTSLQFVEGSGLGSVDAANLDDHFTYCPPDASCPTEDSPFVAGSARSGQSPILFDHDGSMTDAVQGEGASESILGFAGPRVVEREGGVLYITEGQAILNGKFINGVSNSSDPEIETEEYKGAIIHELGHFMGIDHTQVNLASVVKHLNGDTSEKSAIPTMLALFVDGESQLTLHFDDQVAVSFLYPSSDYSSSFCRMQGVVFESDGATELQGVNVLAKNADDPLSEVTSFVSGAHYSGGFFDCDAGVGDYQVTGLTPGRSYTLSIEQISQTFTGGSSVEPCDPPQSGFDAKTVSGLFACSSGGEVITAGTEVGTSIVTTKTATTTADDGADSTSSSGGCSLIPF